MKHKVFGNQLGRRTNQAKALYRSLFKAMLINGRIETTKAKALAVRGDLEQLILLSKTDSVNNRRLAARIMGTDEVVALFARIGPSFKDVNSGFTRIIKLGERLSDTSQMVLFELTRMPVSPVVVAPKVSQKPEVIETKKPATKVVKKTAVAKTAKKK